MYKMELMDMYTAQLKQQQEAGINPDQQMQEQQQSLQNNVVSQAGAGLQNMAQQFT
jgi:hypothetical protein